MAVYPSGKNRRDLSLRIRRTLCLAAVPDSFRYSQEVELFFRVTTPMENVRTRVVCNGDILSKKKRIRINPGEMESLKISTDKIHGNEITVEVQQEVSE